MHLFVLGLGYSAQTLARRALDAGWRVGGTVRDNEKALRLAEGCIEALAFDADKDDVEAVAARLATADALLVTIPPGAGADRLPERLAEAMSQNAPRLAWIGYLSTIGVYGDHGGGWVDETTPCTPISARSMARIAAEASWTKLGCLVAKPVIVFRLPGIYGPGRNALVSLRGGTAKRIVKPGQVFNRIHVVDIATALMTSICDDVASAVYNLTDDEPAPPQDVIAYAASLLRIEPPPEILFEQAQLSPMAASFYAENKRVRNTLIRKAIGFAPEFPSYREGLDTLFAEGEGRP
jgi:nucleoside-diphosphate-sugar epimerase